MLKAYECLGWALRRCWGGRRQARQTDGKVIIAVLLSFAVECGVIGCGR